MTADLIKWASEKNIILFVLPPHTSHVLQPLDVAVFGSFKAIYYALVQEYMRRNIGTIVDRYNICEISSKAYAKSNTPANIISGFRRTGIYPLNPDVVTPALLAPSLAPQTAVSSSCLLTSFLQNKVPTVAASAVTPRARKQRKSYGGRAMVEPESVEDAATPMHYDDDNHIPEAACTTPMIHDDDQLPEAACTPDVQISGISRDDAQPGPSGLPPVVRPVEDHHDDDSEDELCCVCQKLSPPGLRKQTSLRFVEWAQCSNCLHWTHLEFCSSVTRVSKDEEFLCPHCQPRQARR